MHYNVIKTAAGARTRLRLPMVWKADAVAAEELPEAVFWVFIGGERVRVEKTPHSEDEYIFPALQSGQYAWDLVVDAQVVLHGVLKVRGSAVPPGGGEVCGTLLVDAPAMVLVLSPGPRGEVGPVGPQGLSAYEVALQHGYEGSEDDWAEELSGAQAAATESKRQAGHSASSAAAAANSATAAQQSATAAGNSASDSAQSATAADSRADAADKSAKAAKQDADRANTEANRANTAMTEIERTLLPAAEKAKKDAQSHAGDAASSAKAADSSATTAREQASAAANSATAAATAADAVKYDLLPIAVDWLHTQFVQEIGDGNFTVALNEEQKTLNVAFAHDIPEEQCERLLQLCRRVTPQIVGVVRAAVPLDYTELEYLESSGTQNIAVPAPDLETTKERWNVETDMQFLGATAKIGFNNRGGLSWGLYANNTIGVNDTTSGMQISVAEPFKRYIIGYSTKVYDYRWDITLAVNGEEISPRVGNGAVPTEYRYGIFKTFYDSSPSITKPIRVWSCKCWCVSVSYDLIPVLDEEGTPCMWDTVSHQKLPNVGTGTFGYRIKATGEVVEPNATTYSLRAPRDPYYVAPSGVYARLAGENELEILADTEETTGEGWVWFANTAEAYEQHFGIVTQEEFSTE